MCLWEQEFVERQREASEWKEVFWDSELEAQSPQEISSDTYIIEMELKDNFIITNLSIGTNYSGWQVDLAKAFFSPVINFVSSGREFSPLLVRRK